MLGDLVPDWHLPPITEFLKSIPFFQFLDDKTISGLLLESKDYEFERDYKLIRVSLYSLYFICFIASISKGTRKSNRIFRYYKGMWHRNEFNWQL